MEEPQENTEVVAADPEPAKPKRFNIAAATDHLAKAIFGFLPRFGLLLFMTLTPLLLAAYPVYILAGRLVDYSAAEMVEAKYVGMDINTEEGGDEPSSSAKKHIKVALAFEDDNGKKYVSVFEKSWPAPGLKRKLEDHYQSGDIYTLYLIHDKDIVTDDEVAKDTFRRLTCLMALVFMGSGLFFLLWHRLAVRMPQILPMGSLATAKSVMFGQLVTLLMASLLLAILSYSPIIVQPLMYLGAYWGLAIFISLSLRLLLFEEPHVPPPPEAEKSDTHRTERPR